MFQNPPNLGVSEIRRLNQLHSLHFRGAKALFVLNHLNNSSNNDTPPWGFPFYEFDLNDLQLKHHEQEAEKQQDLLLQQLPTPPIWEFDLREVIIDDGVDKDFNVNYYASCVCQVKSGPDYKLFSATQFVHCFNDTEDNNNPHTHPSKRVALFVGMFPSKREAEKQLFAFKIYCNEIGKFDLHITLDERVAAGANFNAMHKSGHQCIDAKLYTRSVSQLRLGTRPCGGCGTSLSKHRCGKFFIYFLRRFLFSSLTLRPFAFENNSWMCIHLLLLERMSKNVLEGT